MSPKPADPNVLTLGIPKGSLQDATVDLFDRAGYKLSISSRSYYPSIDADDMKCVMFRAQEMARYCEDGIVDVGITGHDWVVENNADVVEVCELEYSKATPKPVRWVLAVPEESGIETPEQLEGGIVATEIMGLTQRFFEDRNINVKIEFSWGATEVKARMVDAIVDVTETGSSLRANKLKVIADLLVSTTRLVANKDAWADPRKRQRIEDLAVLLKGAIAATNKVGLKMNVPKDKVEEALAIFADKLDEGQSPTVNQLADSDWVALDVIVERTVERDLVPSLRRVGAKSILSYSLNKVIS